MRRILARAPVLLLLLFPQATRANFWWWRPRPAEVRVQYYYPAPVLVVPAAPVVCPPAPPVVGPPRPGPGTPGVREFATPTPAPPSGRNEPPMDRPGDPARAASPSHYYDPYPVAARGARTAAGDRCLVAFWNLSGRDLVLKVDGRTQTLPRGRNVEVELGRKFVWQIDGREPKTETIAAEDGGVDILIRR